MPEPKRSIGAPIPLVKADQFYDVCKAVGVTQSSVLEKAVDAFIQEHSHRLQPDQDALPVNTYAQAS